MNAHRFAGALASIAALAVSACAITADGLEMNSADGSTVVANMKAVLTPDEITLSGSEKRRMYEGSEAREYRVCVKSQAESALMKVISDGKDLEVLPGGCEFVTGRRISATPARPLEAGTCIVLTFHHERPEKR
jgi:hypothetical protein